MKFKITCKKRSHDPEDTKLSTEVIECKSRAHAKQMSKELKKDMLVDSVEIKPTKEYFD